MTTDDFLSACNSPIIQSFAGFEWGENQKDLLRVALNLYNPVDLEVRFRKPLSEILEMAKTLGLEKEDTSDLPIVLLTKHLQLREIKYLKNKLKKDAKKYANRFKKPLVRSGGKTCTGQL